MGLALPAPGKEASLSASFSSGTKLEPIAIANLQELRFEKVAGLSEMIHCWQSVRQALTNSHYGLSATRFLPTEYGRLVCHQYFRVFDGESPIAVIRMIPNIDLRNYKSNLHPEFLTLVNQGMKFIDVGLYYSNTARSTQRNKITRESILFSAKYSQDLGMHGLYIQVPTEHRAYYERNGFLVAGGLFLPDGWNKQYVPMYRLSR